MSRYHRQDCIGKYLKAINVNKTIFVFISEHDHYTSFIVSGVSWWNVHNKSYKGTEFLSSIIHFESKKRGDLSEIKYTDKIQISLFAFWLFIFTFFSRSFTVKVEPLQCSVFCQWKEGVFVRGGSRSVKVDSGRKVSAGESLCVASVWFVLKDQRGNGRLPPG